MSDIVIKVEDLSKAYQIGQIGTGTISRDLERFWTTKVMGNPDPFLKIGEANDRSVKGESDIVWSLRDVNFEINQGDAIGIIGKNGAGKSTLLKLLSRVTSPTTGEIRIKGRIASLLEVGTGFHPELSGRENIFLNGAILGMRKSEISRKLDEIIDFSGVERYVDTPVKRYSSGMYVRLAFAVAAHLESEILIVDEVLAVGDAEFQKKCLGKMGDISKGEGRTVLFVSHNMAAVQNLCNRGLLIENGSMVHQGDINGTITRYLQGNSFLDDLSQVRGRKGNGKIKFQSVNVYGNQLQESVISGQQLHIDLKLLNLENITSDRIRLDVRVEDDFGQRLSWVSSSLVDIDDAIVPQQIRIFYPRNNFNNGIYFATLFLTVDGEVADWIDNAFQIIVESGDFFNNGRLVPNRQSKILMDFNMTFSS
ncbi:ATP-binding cassette domain-containing protein [Flavobacterium sp. CYK-4]|uniref:ABC transporter ATP-binding protein n=1 Tax=Flavobacterium lotistagni TaxID=2709660 RepID=UPI00140A6EC8|nr:ABC transporter ATP-binding protein [Flavobacterium lotistagni]NHM06416.1 ATP-binding cassette domain-containing protein [Flavobacterium lotistagni]